MISIGFRHTPGCYGHHGLSVRVGPRGFRGFRRWHLFSATVSHKTPEGYPRRLRLSFLGGAGTMFVLRDRYVDGVRRPWHLRGFTIGVRLSKDRTHRFDHRTHARLYITRNANRYL